MTVESVVGSVGVALRCRIPSAQANEQTDESVSACGRPFSQLGERPPGGLTPFFFWVSVRDQRAAHSTASVRNEPAPKPRGHFPPAKGRRDSHPLLSHALFSAADTRPTSSSRLAVSCAPPRPTRRARARDDLSPRHPLLPVLRPPLPRTCNTSSVSQAVQVGPPSLSHAVLSQVTGDDDVCTSCLFAA